MKKNTLSSIFFTILERHPNEANLVYGKFMHPHFRWGKLYELDMCNMLFSTDQAFLASI